MIRAFVVGFMLMFGLTVWVHEAHAAPPGDAPGDAACGAVNVLNTAPTEVPCQNITVGKQINSCMVQNLGPNVIYCNFSQIDGGAFLLDGGASTSVNWGVQVPANGGVYPFDMRMVNAAAAANKPRRLWCQAKTADQVTGETNTRFCGMR